MQPTVNRSRLFEFTDDELNAWTAFDQWNQENRQTMSLDEARIPLRRPQGTTISIPGGCISDADIFPQTKPLRSPGIPDILQPLRTSTPFLKLPWSATAPADCGLRIR